MCSSDLSFDRLRILLFLKIWRHRIFVTLTFVAKNWDALSPTNLKTLFPDFADISQNELEQNKDEALDSITRRALIPWWPLKDYVEQAGMDRRDYK